MIVGDVTNIYWVEQGQEPIPGQTGQRDVLFQFHKMERVNFQGDGRFALWKTGLDVWLRLSLALDRTAMRRDWTIKEMSLVDGINDALDGFFPMDTDNNGLTLEGFVPAENSEPKRNAA